MKRYLLILVWLVFAIIFFADRSGAVCPEDHNDSGICDTMRVEIWPADQVAGASPHFARFPIYVTHDVPDPSVDSLVGFIIPLCYTHTNSTKYCSTSSYWNEVYPINSARGIFHHLPDNDHPAVHNWMLDLYEAENEWVWNTIVLDLDGTSHFWFSIIATGENDQRFGPGSGVLLVTMTFKLEDTMSVCLERCFWPPSGRLGFSRSIGLEFIPRDNLPMCQNIGWHPFTLGIECPETQSNHINGDYMALNAAAYDETDVIVDISASFAGQGVENVRFVDVNGLNSNDVTANVAYHVSDHCQAGGVVQLVATDAYGYKDTCFFSINLSNSIPVLTVPDSIFALVDLSSGFLVSATDADNDEITTNMNALWFAQDSLQSPVNSPSYSGNNPGSFSWVPAASDTGTWIASFSATDVCGMENTEQVRILVGKTSCGDCTRDSIIDVGDVVYLINYLFKGGSAPDPVCRGDVNCSGVTEVGDAVLLINYLYKGGTAPCLSCCR